MTNKCTIISNLSHCYMFRHFHVILGELVVSTLLSYTSISSAAVGNTIYNFTYVVEIPMFKIFKILNCPIYNELSKIILLLSFT